MKRQHRQLRNRLLSALLALLMLLLAYPPSASAQGIIIHPPFPPFPPPIPEAPPVPQPITVEATTVVAQVDGPSIHVRLSQVFRNQSAQVVEGQFVFPLPVDAAVTDFQMRVDGTVLEGKLLPADEARAIYRQIVQQQRDPALLQYLGGGLFQTNVFPIPPGEVREVQLTYTHLAERDGDLYRFRFPLTVGGGGKLPGEFELRVDLTNQPGIRTVYSPNFGATVQRLGPNDAEVNYRGAPGRGEALFDLYWGTSESRIGLNLLSYRPVEEDGYFTLLVAPDVAATVEEVVARDVVLVMDVSGSMQGDKMAQAREAAAYLVQQLNPDDRFALLSFSTGIRRWSAALEPVTTENVTDALAWIARLDAGGSTDINRALLDALAMLDDTTATGRPAYLLFMTDGLPTHGETDMWRILDNVRANTPATQALRLFSFGVGYDVNTVLLDELSKGLGGRSTYVLPAERIDEAVSQFYTTISTPVLTHVAVEISGAGVIDEVYPYPLPDLFAGEQLVVTGRYRDGGEVTVTLSGEVNGRATLTEYTGLGLRTRGGEPFVARLWATRKIGHLMEQVRRSGPDPEVVDAIVALSLEYGIVTPYTAYLVEEPGMLGPQAGVPAGAPEIPAMGGGPQDLAPAAEAYAAEEAARAAALPPSGPGAVAASQTQNALQTADSVAPAGQAQFVGGKTFVQQGWVTGAGDVAYPLWVDTAYTREMTLRWLLFGSDTYFALAEHDLMSQWLAVGSEMVVVLDENSALRVTTLLPDGVAEVDAAVQPAPDRGPTAEPLPTPISPQQPAESEHPEDIWTWLWNLLFPPR